VNYVDRELNIPFLSPWKQCYTNPLKPDGSRGSRMKKRRSRKRAAKKTLERLHERFFRSLPLQSVLPRFQESLEQPHSLDIVPSVTTYSGTFDPPLP